MKYSRAVNVDALEEDAEGNTTNSFRRTTASKVSPDVAGQAEQLFALLDDDHDGLLTKAEFVGQAAALDMSEAEAATLFDLLDMDGDGEIDRSEFTSVSSVLISVQIASQPHCFSCEAAHCAWSEALFLWHLCSAKNIFITNPCISIFL